MKDPCPSDFCHFCRRRVPDLKNHLRHFHNTDGTGSIPVSELEATALHPAVESLDDWCDPESTNGPMICFSKAFAGPLFRALERLRMVPRSGLGDASRNAIDAWEKIRPKGTP